MKESWETRIERAERLAAGSEATRELLSFYAALLRAQKDVYQRLGGRRLSGALAEELDALRELLPGLLRVVEESGPQALAEEARRLKGAGEDEINRMLAQQWREPSDVQFFAKALLQPYASRLAETGARPLGVNVERSEGRCPFCGGRPQVSVLQTVEANAESGGRSLICAVCLQAWPFRRVLCVNCGEERPAKLGYFQTPAYDHVRIEACDACGHYIKGVDLTRLGLAVPLVDEVAAAALDLWAHEHGYTKVELNLVGL